MKRLTATTPVGVFSRRTHRDYQYVIVGVMAAGHYVYRWSGSLRTAEQGVKEATGYGYTVAGIYPVDGTVQS